MSRFVISSLTVWAVVAIPFSVRADDELKAFRARQEVAAQKLASNVSDAIDRSRRLEKTDPLEAQALLKQTLRQVGNSEDLPRSQRTQLIAQLEARLRSVDDTLRFRRVTQDQKPAYRDFDKPKSRPSSYDPPSGGITSAVKNFQDGPKNSVKIAQDANRIRTENINRINDSIERGVPYPTDDRPILFPSKEAWARITERGKPKLSAKEVALLKALNSTLSVNFDGDKFGTVINYLQERTGITINVDEASKQETMLDYEDPVTFKVNKTTVRTILKKVLADKGLTYVIREGSLQVMTPKKASEMVIVRSYPISDLVQPSQMAQMYGPFVARAQMLNNVQQLMNLIQTTIEPSYWQPNGPGSIMFYEPAQALVIRGSAEMHFQLGSGGLFGR